MVVQECQAVPDGEVVERVRAGETGLYELLMRRYNQRLFRLVRSVTGNDAEAEDVVQDAWVRAYSNLDQFEARSSFGTWVGRIAYHEALARARKAKRWTALDETEGVVMTDAYRQASSENTPEALAMRGEAVQMMQDAVDNLPESYRTVFVLREVEQMSTAETAEYLGLSEEAVKTRLHRSRALLRSALEEKLGAALSGAYAFLGARCDRMVAAVMTRIGG
jgi:RNA polymerase sigma-70 factor (ECF subfamily)